MSKRKPPAPHCPRQQRRRWRNSWAACLAQQPALWEDGSIGLAELPMASLAQSAGPREALVLIRACSNSAHHSLSSPSGSLCPCHVEWCHLDGKADLPGVMLPASSFPYPPASSPGPPTPARASSKPAVSHQRGSGRSRRVLIHSHSPLEHDFSYEILPINPPSRLILSFPSSFPGERGERDCFYFPNFSYPPPKQWDGNYSRLTPQSSPGGCLTGSKSSGSPPNKTEFSTFRLCFFFFSVNRPTPLFNITLPRCTWVSCFYFCWVDFDAIRSWEVFVQNAGNSDFSFVYYLLKNH